LSSGNVINQSICLLERRANNRLSSTQLFRFTLLLRPASAGNSQQCLSRLLSARSSFLCLRTISKAIAKMKSALTISLDRLITTTPRHSKSTTKCLSPAQSQLVESTLKLDRQSISFYRRRAFPKGVSSVMSVHLTSKQTVREIVWMGGLTAVRAFQLFRRICTARLWSETGASLATPMDFRKAVYICWKAYVKPGTGPTRGILPQET
jgi:hypothetical protein